MSSDFGSTGRNNNYNHNHSVHSTSGASTGSNNNNNNNSNNNNATSNTNNPGSSHVVGGVEEVSGMNCPAISTLDRQYEAPIGQRLLLFVRTNANCCLQGGVETILKLQKSHTKDSKRGTGTGTGTGSNSNSIHTHNNVNLEQDLDYPYTSNRNSSNNQSNSNQEDPYAFLQEEPDAFDSFNTASTSNNTNSNSKGPNLGRFLKKVAKQTTGALERGMHELAIKADQGRNPDLLTAALFSSNVDNNSSTNNTNNTTELIAMTDAVPLPRISAGVNFCLPLWIPPRIQDNSNVTIKLFIHSQASLMISATGKPKTKHFLLGQTHLQVGQIRQLVLQQRKGFFSLPLQAQALPHASTLVAEGQLHFCVLPDLKLPTLGQRGWSLSDPKFSGYASGLYNPPLDQSYALHDHDSSTIQQQQQQQWLIATERAMESTIVLPIAAAFAHIAAQACQVSILHSQAIAAQLLAKRTEQKDPGHCARVQMDLQYMQIDTTPPSQQQQQQQQQANLTLAWQPPDSIFELELIPSVPIPVGGPYSQQQQQQPTLQFFPPVCTTGILPAILKAYGGRMPPTGYILGNLRLQIPMPSSTSSSSSSKQPQEIWEAIVVLEQHVAHPQQPPQEAKKALQLPLYSLTSGQKMGSIMVTLSVQLETPTAPVPQQVSPQRGLVAMVGLEDLIEGVTPTVDQMAQPAPTLTDDARRRHQQLATMGSFMSHAYLDQHNRSRRQADLELFQQRAQQYRSVLDRNNNTPTNSRSSGVENSVPSWEDMSPRPFRPSSSRPELLLSGIPFNTHNASFSLDIMDPNNHTHHPQPDGALFHNITCGAPADHASGFGNVFVDKTFTSPIGSVSGGLRRLEAKRYELAQVVRSTQTQLIAGVAHFFQSARQQQKYLNHVPARNSNLQNLRWKVFEAVHAYHHVTWICAVRRASAFSQALGIAVTSYLTSLSDSAKCQTSWPQLWARHGYLVSYEGLLSAAGKELGMIEDASVAISMLHMVRIVLVPDDGTSNSNMSRDPTRVPIPHSPLLKWVHLTPTPNGSHTQYLLQIGVHSHYYEQRVPPCLKNGTQVQLFPVLFQVGVDIRQWGAHAGSNMKNQFAGGDSGGGGLLDDEDDDVGVADDDVLVALNYEALQKMNAYAHLLSPVQGGAPSMSGNPFDAFVEPATQKSSQQQVRGMNVHPSLTMLHSHIMTSAGKMNHSILDEAATMAQQLGGGGVVFCKSGKDRTAMHVTYKQAQFANRFRQQRYSNQEILDTTLEDATRMRIYGTRLPVCEKNVGQALYAFNSLQSKFMPDALKPPPSTLAGFLKGGRLLSGGGIET